MPFPYTLPTTSSVAFSDFFNSRSHPSLCLNATTRRSVLKDALKKHKRLNARDKPAHLSIVQDALSSYIPCLLVIDKASSLRDIGNERVDLDVTKPFEAEWRATLSATLPGREAPRPKLTGLHHEIAFTLSASANVQSLLARNQLRGLYDSGNVLSAEQRASNIGTAMKYLLESNSIHSYLVSLPSISAATDAPVDIQASTISALASLALAEATLIVVSKDDPYAAAVADDRNESNTDWMFKAPSIPKVRAHLFARICLAAAEHAATAQGLLARATNGKVDESLVKYATDLRRTARGKAARFLAIDAELSAKTGEGLAWLKGAKKELGMAVTVEDGSRKGFRGLKQSWQERREDRKVEKGGEWGLDAGRFEEARVVEMLETKWDKENSTVNVQVVPPFEPLIASMPSGREYNTPQVYVPPMLDSETLMKMRAPPDLDEAAFQGDEDDSGDERSYGNRVEPPGGFPIDASRSRTSNNYY